MDYKSGFDVTYDPHKVKFYFVLQNKPAEKHEWVPEPTNPEPDVTRQVKWDNKNNQMVYSDTLEQWYPPFSLHQIIELKWHLTWNQQTLDYKYTDEFGKILSTINLVSNKDIQFDKPITIPGNVKWIKNTLVYAKEDNTTTPYNPPRRLNKLLKSPDFTTCLDDLIQQNCVNTFSGLVNRS